MNDFKHFPCINTTTLSMLRRNTASNPAILDELFGNFIEDAEELIKEIESGIKENQVESYFTAVHTLKGLCGTIGCTQMFEVLKVMDSLNKENDFQLSKTFFDNLVETFQNTCTAIQSQVVSKDSATDES